MSNAPYSFCVGASASIGFLQPSDGLGERSSLGCFNFHFLRHRIMPDPNNPSPS